MDGGGGGGGVPAPHMNKSIVESFVEEFLAVLSIAAIATALNIHFCLTLPPSNALPVCALCSLFGMIVSFRTLGSNIGYMLRGFPYERWEPEGMFAHFCIQFNYLVCNGLLMVLGIIAYGAAYRKLEIVGIDFEASKEKDDKISHKALLRALCLEPTGDKIAYFAVGIFCFNFSSCCCPRFIIQIPSVLSVAVSFCLFGPPPYY
jgi:hypothetical protein